MVSRIVDPIALYYDNNRVIAQTNELKSYQWSKHILKWFHFIRES